MTERSTKDKLSNKICGTTNTKERRCVMEIITSSLAYGRSPIRPHGLSDDWCAHGSGNVCHALWACDCHLVNLCFINCPPIDFSITTFIPIVPC
jgi:hypothetical protein